MLGATVLLGAAGVLTAVVLAGFAVFVDGTPSVGGAAAFSMTAALLSTATLPAVSSSFTWPTYHQTNPPTAITPIPTPIDVTIVAHPGKRVASRSTRFFAARSASVPCAFRHSRARHVLTAFRTLPAFDNGGKSTRRDRIQLSRPGVPLYGNRFE